MARELLSVFEPLPPQRAFLKSGAVIRGYGGAMGGGKSRTGCEAIFDACLDHPGLMAVVARQAHTSIINTTRKTMLTQVIPPVLIERSKASQGEDYIELFNGSTIHFVGLDDPIRWYSSEIGYLFFDESQEIEEDVVSRMITRLRQPCPECISRSEPNEDGDYGCEHYPHRAILTFNPSHPNHWLYRWFITGAEKTEFGFYKPELFLDDEFVSAGVDDEPDSLGDCEFVFARATDNKYLPKRYLKFLKGQKPHLRRRYFEGLWESDEGCFFDADAIAYYQALARDTKPLAGAASLLGDIQQDILHRLRGGPPPKDPVRIKPGRGPLTVFRKPVRESPDAEGRRRPAHRYVIGVDSSSGSAEDWTAMQVMDVEEFEQVAEFQAKIPPSAAAEWAYRLGRVYNDAMIICEVTGGWGFAVDQKLRELRYPRPYTRRAYDRLAKKFTDKLGFDTTSKTRPLILGMLEEAIREREVGIYGDRTVAECGAFVDDGSGRPEAATGAHDDLVFALALAVFGRSELPRQVRRVKERPYIPQFSATGY